MQLATTMIDPQARTSLMHMARVGQEWLRLVEQKLDVSSTSKGGQVVLPAASSASSGGIP